MRIITDKPFPLLERVKTLFPVTNKVVFSYGEDLYAHPDVVLPMDLMIHEATHSVQQSQGVEIWWERYLTDPAYRLAQEVQAYRAQYQFYCSVQQDRNARAKFLHRISKDLSSPLYGSLCAFSDAMRLILHGK